MRENEAQNNPEYVHFLRSECSSITSWRKSALIQRPLVQIPKAFHQHGNAEIYESLLQFCKREIQISTVYEKEIKFSYVYI